MALVPTCITELIILYKLKLNELKELKENDESGGTEEPNSGT